MTRYILIIPPRDKQTHTNLCYTVIRKTTSLVIGTALIAIISVNVVRIWPASADFYLPDVKNGRKVDALSILPAAQL
jgi:hypothetical protein